MTDNNDDTDDPRKSTIRPVDYTDFIRALGPEEFRWEHDYETGELRQTFPCFCGRALAARYPMRNPRRRYRKLPAEGRSRAHRCRSNLDDLEAAPNAALFALRLADPLIPRSWAETP